MESIAKLHSLKG